MRTGLRLHEEGEGEEKEEEERKRSRRVIIWIHASDRWAEVSTRVARPNDEFATSRSSSSSSSSPSRSLHHQQQIYWYIYKLDDAIKVESLSPLSSSRYLRDVLGRVFWFPWCPWTSILILHIIGSGSFFKKFLLGCLSRVHLIKSLIFMVRLNQLYLRFSEWCSFASQ